MYSEKLKKLVEKEVSLKFRIKNEQQSKELQEFLFTLGVCWSIRDSMVVRNIKKPFFYLQSNLAYRLFYGDCEEIFEEQDDQEFDLEKDCLVKEKHEFTVVGTKDKPKTRAYIPSWSLMLHWISVEERKPEDEQDVLVVFYDSQDSAHHDPVIAWYDLNHDRFIRTSCPGFCDSDECHHYSLSATHWMPLPMFEVHDKTEG